jgi:hypothetical protein
MAVDNKRLQLGKGAAKRTTMICSTTATKRGHLQGGGEEEEEEEEEVVVVEGVVSWHRLLARWVSQNFHTITAWIHQA